MGNVDNQIKEIIDGTPDILKNYIEATRSKSAIKKTSESLKRDILKKVESAINKLYEDDMILLTDQMNEVTICGRLAIYLHDLFRDYLGYYIDIEYYRLRRPKNEANLREDRIRCDILLHSRGTYERRVDNLLAIEVKLENNHDDGSSDRKRLAEFVLPEISDTPANAVHSTLIGLFLRIGITGYSSVLLTSREYIKKQSNINKK